MNDLSDAELLRRFAKDDSEAAFAVLVERYLGLVHSVAARQTNNLQHAQDISQAVFIILARKAGALDSKTVLSGWLYHTARLTAANFNRAEWRRARREQEAFMQAETNDHSSEVAWRELSPKLETAMAQLGPADHDALVMRYFQNRSIAEVGTAFGWTENTAQKRVGRALEKLRKFFDKRGIALTGGTIAATLSANAVQAAPAGLAKAITPVAATKGAAASIATAKLVKVTLKIMPWSYLGGLISLAFLYVSSAIGLSAVFVRLMSQMFKGEDSGEPSSHDFVDRHNVFELRKKYWKHFSVFGVLAVLCFVSYNVLGIWTNGDPEVEAHLWRTVGCVVIAVFLTAVVIVWRKIGGFRGWNARMARRNEIIQKELWADDPNPAVPTDFDNVFQSPFKQNGLVFYVPLFGLACCVVSFICMVRNIGGLTPPIVFVGGWVIGVTGTYLCARKARKGWLLADARCIKQMVKRVATSGAGGGGSSGFSAIIVCEYEYAGVKYRVTPKITAVAIVSFPTAGTVERYLRKKIAPDGTCKLHFNPGNPLQTTLYGGGRLERFLANQPRQSKSMNPH
jgi:RNA polymerase sigma factor (sigma-70 family)